jgi:hypothetical protein
MSKMKNIMMMYAMAGMMGGMGGIGSGKSSRQRQAEEMEDFKEKAKKRAATLPKHWNGQQQLHKYTINGVEIEATDLKSAKKIYNRKY